ncbi:MAG TPA: hypothetical protein DF613_14545 [Lachnospiraceae bacterium]|nr:hypothetical protein [Lachnospiraceae bacterium]
MKKSKKEPSVFRQELHRDWNTFKSLDGKKKLRFLWDYYRWKILVSVFVIITVVSFANILWEGQRPCRLRVCVVLNNDADCSGWFHRFAQDLKADGKPGKVDINLDQPFDYDNQYYYVQELEVMTTVSSRRMDLAVCGPDMYSYLLAINACMPLDEALPDSLFAVLMKNGKLVYSTANLTQNEHGNVNPADGIDGYYAVDLSGTAFYDTYNQPAEGKEQEPLYAVIISNTEHMEDCETLLNALLTN